MSAKREKAGTIADLMKAAPTDMEQAELFTRMGENPDNTLVLLSVTFLDRALRTAITQHLKSSLSADESDNVFDDTKDGPLATFAAKYRLAYALGIFGQRTMRDLKRLGRIRNAFAHVAARVNFKTPEIAKECLALEAPSKRAKDPKQSFLISFWIYWPAISGHRIDDKSLLQEKYREDLC